MARQSWTELFFLDEAVALAAGHRPCFFCRRTDAQAFQAAWPRPSDAPSPKAGAMDCVLHEERLDGHAKRLHPIPGRLASLPDGTAVSHGRDAYTLAAGIAWRWTEHGYEGPHHLRDAEALLTPPSTVMVLRAGYRPRLHPSIAVS